MNNKIAVLAFGLVFALGLAFLAAPYFRGGADVPPAAAPFSVPGTPAVVYDAILPEVRERIARETKIVRIDSHDGALTMRFSAYLEDHSVRLVEIALAPAAPDGSRVSVSSRRFSFLPGRSRDANDALLEGSLAELVRRRAAAVPPAAPAALP